MQINKMLDSIKSKNDIEVIFQKARYGLISLSDIKPTADELEKTDPIKAIKLYRTWISCRTKTDNDTSIARYILGLLLYKSGDYILSEQSFMSCCYENATMTQASSIILNDLSARNGNEYIRNFLLAARTGTLKEMTLLLLHERIYDIMPLNYLFEIYTHVTQRIRSKFSYIYWYELGSLSLKLGYTARAINAFHESLQINPEFMLAKITLSCFECDSIIPLSNLSQITMFKVDKTADYFIELTSVIGDEVAAIIYKEWLKHFIGSQPYFSAYGLGEEFRKRGAPLEAEWAFQRSRELNPNFLRAHITSPHVTPVMEIDNRALLNAIAIKSGETKEISMPEKDNAATTTADETIIKAPHLYRQLVMNKIECISNNSNEKTSSYTHRYNTHKKHKAIDRCCRILNKLDRISNPPPHTETTRAVVAMWQGVGDLIYINGAVRYLSTMYDSVYVMTSHEDHEGIMGMFRDDPAIKWYKSAIDYSKENSSVISSALKTTGMDLYISNGGWGEANWICPDSNYHQLGIDPINSKLYFYIKPYKEGDELLIAAKNAANNFIFVHEQSSEASCISYVKEHMSNNNDTLYICPDKNLYNPGEKFYEIAQQFIWPEPTESLSFPIFWYMQIMENASELLLIDSSFFALARYLDRKKDQKITCYSRNKRHENMGCVDIKADFISLNILDY